ncbi:MAG: response regulator [Bacteroidetes bacterium]|nr:response regulator [Bacteroidota bacterium]
MRQYCRYAFPILYLVINIEVAYGQITTSKRQLEYNATELSITFYQVESGLPSNNILGVVQSNDGFIYISTIDGLLRFDGVQFRKFSPDHTNYSDSPVIRNPKVDKFNNIWVLNDNYTNVLRFDGEQYHGYPSYWYDKALNDFIVTTSGDPLIANQEGLFLYKETQDFNGFSLLSSEPVVDLFTNAKGDRTFYQSFNALYEYKNGNIELLYRFDFKSIIPSWEQPIRLYMIDESRFVVLVDGTISLLHLTPNKTVEMREILSSINHVSYSNIDQLHIIKGRSIYEYDTKIEKLKIVDSQVFAKGIIINDLNKISATTPEGLRDFSVYAYKDSVIIGSEFIKGITGVSDMMIDRQGLVWLTTGRFGLVKIRRNQIKNFINQDIPVNSYSITEWEGMMYGISQFGLFQLGENDNIKDTKLSNAGLPASMLAYTYKNRRNELLASPFREGLWGYDETNNRWVEQKALNNTFSEEFIRIHSILETDSISYIAANQGVVKTKDWESFSLLLKSQNIGSKEIGSISIWGSGDLLVATIDNGLWGIRNNQSPKQINFEAGSLDNIRQIYVHTKDTVFLAGWNRGIRRLVIDTLDYSIQDYKELTSLSGLKNNYIHGLVRDNNGHFWFSTNGGLGRISVKNLNGFLNGKSELALNWFGQRDGIGNEEFNGGTSNSVFKDSKHRLWFANQDGLVMVNPNIFNPAWITNPYQVSIERFYSESGYLETLNVDTVILAQGDRRLALFYSIPDFLGQPIDYNYRIIELDNDWISNGERRVAVYSDVRPGTYTYQVKAELMDGAESVDELIIIVPSFFYEEAWFQWLLFLVLVGCVLLGFSIQAKRIKKWRELNLLVQKTLYEKERLFHSIAHELRTPLTLILHPLERVMELYSNRKNSKQHKEILRAHKNANRLKDLINQISDIRVITSEGQLPIKLEAINLTNHINDLLSDYVEWSEYLNIKIEFKIDTVTTPINLDRKGIDRIFSNLIMNALRYNLDNGKVRVELIDNSDFVQLKISNQGIGISDSEVPFIFDYLYQGKNAKGYKGTGIGLYLVKYWVDAMNGIISVESILNDWTTFTVSFPKQAEADYEAYKLRGNRKVGLNAEKNILPSIIKNNIWAQDLSSSDDKSNNHDIVQLDSLKQTILVVDDDKDILESVSLNLLDDYNLKVAANAYSALEIIKSIHIDLVITDIRMPEISGLELVSAIRDDLKLKNTPVIYYSALDHQELTREGLSTGADIYLKKDVSLEEFLYTVKDTLEREKKASGLLNIDGQPGDTHDLVSQIEAIVIRHLSDKSLKAEWLAEQLFISRASLYRRWAEVSNQTLNDYIRSIKIREAKEIMLNDPDIPMRYVAKSVGYSSYAYFSSQFKKVVGVTPVDFMKTKNP